MATLDLSKSGYGVEVLSYYLWGQATAPNKSEIANGKWLQKKQRNYIKCICKRIYEVCR